MTSLHWLGTAAMAAFMMTLAACGGGSTGGGGSASPGAPSNAATLSVRLVDAPTQDFQAITVHIAAVEIGGDSGWITLGTPDQSYNLLALTGGLSATLAPGTPIPPGQYSQMRLILTDGNTVTLADGSVKPLKVPSGMQTGIKMALALDVQAGDAADVWIDFDASQSVQAHGAGASGKFILRPTVRAYSDAGTGSISGVLTDAVTGAPLPGVAVYAETLDGLGTPAIARGTFTDGNGAYTLDLLTLGTPHHVVSQPVVEGEAPVAYEAVASEAITPTFEAKTAAFDAAFTPAAGTGSIGGTLTATALENQSDVVDLLQVLGSGGETFIVRNTMAAVDGEETYGFDGVPAGDYAVQAVRTTDNGDGTTSSLVAVSGPAALVGGGTLTLDITGLP